MIPMKLNFFSEETLASGGSAGSSPGQEKNEPGAAKENQDEKQEKNKAQGNFLTKEDIAKLIQSELKNLQEQQVRAEKTKNMKPDEAAGLEQKEAETQLKLREAKVLAGELRIKAHGVLAEKGLDAGLLDLLVYTDEESCNKSIATLETVFKAAVEKAADKAVNDKLRGTVPKSPEGTPPESKDYKSAIEAHLKKSGLV